MFAHKSIKFGPVHPKNMFWKTAPVSEYSQTVANSPRSQNNNSIGQMTDSKMRKNTKTPEEKELGYICEMSYKKAIDIVLEDWGKDQFVFQKPSKNEFIFDQNQNIANMFEPIDQAVPYPFDTPCESYDEALAWYNRC